MGRPPFSAEGRKNMYVTEGLEPSRVFHYFEEISRIPHGSGNTKAISDYLVSFARAHQLEWTQDGLNNVIMIKKAAPGCEKAPAVILQGHMDMVCEKEAGTDFDFTRDPLRLRVEGDFISAEGTTLGGDDGIAVAYILALMEAEGLSHPRLEAVITVDEETGMDGAEGIDLSGLQGRLLLNMDSEEEGSLLAGCAGGARAELILPLEREEAAGTKVQLCVQGLLGGHSGCEIHRQRGNANVLLGRLVDGLRDQVRLISLEGGLKDNAIPRRATALVVTEDLQALEAALKKWEAIFKNELAGSDPGVSLAMTVEERVTYSVMTAESARRTCTLLAATPNSVQEMSRFIPGLVETSLNMGILETKENELAVRFSVRSSVESARTAVVRKLALIAESVGAACEVSGEYPAWPYRPESPLRELMTEVYEELYGEKPRVETIHAGLECGLFSGKLPDLDCVSFGPDIFDIHTPAERMSISSVGRTWRYILRVLERLAEK